MKNDLGVDCISRAEVLKIFDEWFATCDIADKKDSPKIKIKALPSVIPQESRWIPVSERLPEEDESVLLTICANSSLYGFNENFVKVMYGIYSPCEDKRDWIVNGIRYYIDNVIAWMPLPPCYEP